MFQYKARFDGLVDKDMFSLVVDLGFRVYRRLEARIQGLAIREECLQEATSFILERLKKGDTVRIYSYTKNKESYTVDLYYLDLDGEEHDLGEELLQTGYVKEI